MQLKGGVEIFLLSNDEPLTFNIDISAKIGLLDSSFYFFSEPERGNPFQNIYLGVRKQVLILK